MKYNGTIVVDGDIRQKTNPGWALAVKKRDGMKCSECGSQEELHAHHIQSWLMAPHLRFDIENGKTLCRRCHLKAHRNEPQSTEAGVFEPFTVAVPAVSKRPIRLRDIKDIHRLLARIVNRVERGTLPIHIATRVAYILDKKINFHAYELDKRLSALERTLSSGNL